MVCEIFWREEMNGQYTHNSGIIEFRLSLVPSLFSLF